MQVVAITTEWFRAQARLQHLFRLDLQNRKQTVADGWGSVAEAECTAATLAQQTVCTIAGQALIGMFAAANDPCTEPLGVA